MFKCSVRTTDVILAKAGIQLGGDVVCSAKTGLDFLDCVNAVFFKQAFRKETLRLVCTAFERTASESPYDKHAAVLPLVHSSASALSLAGVNS